MSSAGALPSPFLNKLCSGETVHTVIARMCNRRFRVPCLRHGHFRPLPLQATGSSLRLFSCSGHALHAHRSGAGFHGSSLDGFSPVMLPYSLRRNYPVSSTPISIIILNLMLGSDKLFSFHRYWCKSSNATSSSSIIVGMLYSASRIRNYKLV
jgi:hypothetical protein